MTNVFIDGSAGTTGLRIRERLADRKDLRLMILPEDLRKDPSARADALNRADVSFLCLPDAAAVEAVSFVTDPQSLSTRPPPTAQRKAGPTACRS